MKTIKRNMAKASLFFCLVLLAVPVTKAQEDRAERLQESISSSDQRTDFSSRKAAPSKIDSAAFQELLTATKKCQVAQQKFAVYQEKYQEKELKGEKLSLRDARALKKARDEWDKARAALKAAERKANAD